MKAVLMLSGLLWLAAPGGLAGQEHLAPIFFIYDASGSMWADMEGRTKKAIAAEVLNQTLDRLPPEQDLGLVAYGHRAKSDCSDVEMLAMPGQAEREELGRIISNIEPLGKTPLADAALQVIDHLREADLEATIILLTDGLESCGGDLCAVVRAAREAGLTFRLHIVGFGLEGEDTQGLRCAAEAGGGRFYEPGDAGSLTDVLLEATRATVNAAPENLTLFALKNGTPVDAFIRAMPAGETEAAAAARTYRDTAFLALPPGTYALEVRALENTDLAPLYVEDVQILPEQMHHQTVSFDGGRLMLTTENNGEGWDAVVKIHSLANDNMVAGGRTYGRPATFELNAGRYAIELQAMNLSGTGASHRIEPVVLEAGQDTELIHGFQSGTLRVGAQSSSGLVDATVAIRETAGGKPVAGGRTYTSASSNPKSFLLTPGTYEVTLRAVGDYSGKQVSFSIRLEAGQTVEEITTF